MRGIVVLKESSGVTGGVIVIIAEYVRKFTRPLSDLANQFNTVLSAIAGAERVFDIMNEPVEQDSKDAIDLNNIEGNIKFNNVNFIYDEEQKTPTIKDLSLKIKSGK